MEALLDASIGKMGATDLNEILTTIKEDKLRCFFG